MINLRLALLGGGLAALIVVALGLYWRGRLEGAARAQPRIDAALSQAASERLAAQGARASAARMDLFLREREAALDTVHSLRAAASSSEDAHAPLHPGRVARLRRADDQLCQLSPDLDGCESAD